MSVFASINLPVNLFMRQVRSFITLFWWLVEVEVPSTSACFLDGKKHDTKVSETLEDGFQRCRDIVTDNYVITDAQRQAYLGTVTPEQGTGGGIAKAATGFVEEKEGLSLKDITMWRGDSTSTNTGPYSGVFSCIDKIAKKAHHRVVCILHLWELLLCVMVIAYVGVTTGPGSFASALGKKLKNLPWPIRVVKFKKIDIVRTFRLFQIRF